MEKHLALILTHMPPSSSASSLLRLHFGTACWSGEWFELGWLKFNPSPAARALSTTTVTWGRKMPLFLPHASLSRQLPEPSTFPLHPALLCGLAGDSWPPPRSPGRPMEKGDKGHSAQIQLEAA